MTAPWSHSVASLLADPSTIYDVPTVLLRRLHTETLTIINAPAPRFATDDQMAEYRERTQQLRMEISRLLEIRRRLDLLDQQSPRMPQDAPDPDALPQDGMTNEARACRLLAAALLLIQGNQNNGSGGGGTRQPVAPRPTRPTPPTQAVDPYDVGF